MSTPSHSISFFSSSKYPEALRFRFMHPLSAGGNPSSTQPVAQPNHPPNFLYAGVLHPPTYRPALVGQHIPACVQALLCMYVGTSRTNADPKDCPDSEWLTELAHAVRLSHLSPYFLSCGEP
jgi:hypothetical protein